MSIHWSPAMADIPRESIMGEISGAEVVLLIAGVLLTLALAGVFFFVLWRSRKTD